MNQMNPNNSNNSKSNWRKGGMSCNGLRSSGIVFNYFPTPGRSNIIPNAAYNAAAAGVVSSIGEFQTSGLKQITTGTYGPGSLQSTNVQVTNPRISNETHRGTVLQNEKRSTYPNYRNTDPALVSALKQNPLSIFVSEKYKNADVPAFYSSIRPDNYSTYVSSPFVPISKSTLISAVNGSPQVNILGLAEQNPFMGITTGIPNENPTFSGKTYGGNNSSSAKKYAMELYDQGWTSNYPGTGQNRPSSSSGVREQNKALHYFAPGYNIAGQINENKMIQWTSRPGMRNNLPWGPNGGIWQRGSNPIPTVPTEHGVESNPRLVQIANLPKKNIKPANCNSYRSDPGFSIICSN